MEAKGSHNIGCRLNTEELKIELDLLVKEHGITPDAAHARLPAADGRRAHRRHAGGEQGRPRRDPRRVFIDATGDGDVAVRAGVPSCVRDNLQPPTPVRKILHFRQEGLRFGELYRQHASEFGLARTRVGIRPSPGLPDIYMVCPDARLRRELRPTPGSLTHAEMDGRRTIRGVVDMLRKYSPKGRSGGAGAASIGDRHPRDARASRPSIA